MAISAPAYGGAPRLTLPDGRLPDFMRVRDVWHALQPLVPGIDASMGKTALIAAYAKHLADQKPKEAPWPT